MSGKKAHETAEKKIECNRVNLMNHRYATYVVETEHVHKSRAMHSVSWLCSLSKWTWSKIWCHSEGRRDKRKEAHTPKGHVCNETNSFNLELETVGATEVSPSSVASGTD